MIAAVSYAGLFGQLGGDSDEFIRFLQLEWESYSQDEVPKDKKSQFYKEIRNYVKYRDKKRNWRKEFSGRDFNDLLV